jgi:hypothetical protein
MTTIVINIKDPAQRIAHDYAKLGVSIGRGGPWGNPFPIALHQNRPACVSRFEKWVRSKPDMIARIKRELKGRVLGCYCKPLACHGDVLAIIAEEP